MILPARLGILQRVLPAYRAPFFDTLAARCPAGLGLFAGQPLPIEGMASARALSAAQWTPARNLHFLHPGSSFYLCWQRGLLAWLEAFQPEILVVEANSRLQSARQAADWMHHRRRPVLGWGLGAPPLHGALAPLRRRERRAFLNRLDGVIAYSQRGAQEYRAAGFPSERVFVAYNAAAMPVLLERAPHPPGAPPTALYVGRMQARKRLDLLFEACAALPPALQPRLLLVGDGPARAEFESAARRLYPQAEFLGARHGDALRPLYAAADLFVLPGTGGLAVQQALAYGLPVIVAQGDGTQDDLVRPDTGWQVTPGSADSLRAALAAALADLPRLRQMGQAAYRLAAAEINLETMADSFVEAAIAVKGLKKILADDIIV